MTVFEKHGNEGMGQVPGTPPNRLARLVAMAVAFAALAILLGTTSAGDPALLRRRIEDSGPCGPLLFVVSAAVLGGLGAPRLPLCGAAGLLFGFAPGLAWAQAGTLLGAWANFGFARWGGRDWARGAAARHARLGAFIEGRPTAWTVVLARQLPVASVVVNFALAMTPLRHPTFLVGSFIGFLPGATVAVLIGSGLVGGSLSEVLPPVAAGVLGLVALGWIVRRLRRGLPALEAPPDQGRE